MIKRSVFVFNLKPSAQRIVEFTVMPLLAINAHATAELYALPEKTRQNAGIDNETGIAVSIINGKTNDSLIEAIII